MAHNTLCCCFFPWEPWINLIMSDAQDKLGDLLFWINSLYGLLKSLSCSYSDWDSSDLPEPISPSYFHDKVLVDSSSACSVSMLSCFSHVRIFATLWTIAHQTSLCMGRYRQEHWGELPCPPPVDLPYLETEPISLMSPSLACRFFTTSATWEAPCMAYWVPFKK